DFYITNQTTFDRYFEDDDDDKSKLKLYTQLEVDIENGIICILDCHIDNINSEETRLERLETLAFIIKNVLNEEIRNRFLKSPCNDSLTSFSDIGLILYSPKDSQDGTGDINQELFEELGVKPCNFYDRPKLNKDANNNSSKNVYSLNSLLERIEPEKKLKIAKQADVLNKASSNPTTNLPSTNNILQRLDNSAADDSQMPLRRSQRLINIAATSKLTAIAATATSTHQPASNNCVPTSSTTNTTLRRSDRLKQKVNSSASAENAKPIRSKRDFSNIATSSVDSNTHVSSTTQSNSTLKPTPTQPGSRKRAKK
ncbi:MAG: hypothetical protein KIT27_05815, partial [Legionellales bacterium]|nr:hypothetical protein [Legionellales bacterium]